MSKYYAKKQTLMKSKEINSEKQKQSNNFFSKNLKKIYPIGLQKRSHCSPISLSSLSLSLSQNSTDDSSPTDSASPPPLEEKILSALHLLSPIQSPPPPHDDEEPRRCSWITKNSDSVYVQFHDECWGVPVYDDNKLFELLAMCGLLMDLNWTEILKRRQLLREAFSGFDPYRVSKMGEKEINAIISNKDVALAERRVRCIVDNAKCITKIARECGSFSCYMWEYVSYKPVINKFRHSRNVPLRSPKAEIISKDLVTRGFRYVGPVIVYSFMQAAGMTVDHLLHCYRYGDCVDLAERPWRHF
ncbi:DNA-3-methyladenine glycosylase-like [Salvia hispanica]|uniref:DNA-3-methyladenine glycosylase-like n=1 Tax=Salvia hispanica TaxID=49212 RepID=UPI0020092113|nr:DNA-3-methyladenine glycosylase-like [Salvia hispanica]